jgi:hypothetical protein
MISFGNLLEFATLRRQIISFLTSLSNPAIHHRASGMPDRECEECDGELAFPVTLAKQWYAEKLRLMPQKGPLSDDKRCVAELRQ